MARQLTNAKPKNMKKTLSSFKKYIGNHKYAFVFIGLLVILSTSISLWGTYQIKTVVNRYVLKNDYHGLVSFIVLMAIVYFIGATATAIYKQLMVHTAQSIVQELRNDLVDIGSYFFDVEKGINPIKIFTNDTKIYSCGIIQQKWIGAE